MPAGLAAKRFGEKRTLIGGFLVVAVGLVLLSYAHTFAEALVWRGVWITGYRFAFVCVMTAIALTCPPSLKGRSMGLLGATSAMASVIGAPAGGLLVRDFGWRLGILWYVAAAIAGAAVLAMFYRRTQLDAPSQHLHAIGAPVQSKSSPSAFRTPLVWALALLLGIGGVGQFSVTFFVPSIARSVYGLDAAAAGLIISAGYICAIAVSLCTGALMDRFDKWRIMGALFVLLTIASLVLASSPSLLVFRLSTAVTLAGGFTAINQLYGIAGDVMRGRETANVMGVVSLGAGVFGYLGPQMLGALRDWTGGFAAGFYFRGGGGRDHAALDRVAAAICEIRRTARLNPADLATCEKKSHAWRATFHRLRLVRDAERGVR